MKQLTVLLLTLVMSISLTFGQNIKLNGAAGAHTIGGNVNVKGDIDNTGAASGALYTFSGTVDLKGTTAQYLVGNSGASGADKIVFTNLTNTGGTAAKTLKYNVDVTTSINVGSSGSFVVGVNTLTITGTSAGTALDASNASGTVAYNKNTTTQTILPSTYGGTLALSANAQKDVDATVVVSGTFTHAGGDLAVAGTGILNYSGSTATLLGVSVASSGNLNNTGTGSLSITTLASNAGTINASGTGRIAFLGNVTNGGIMTTATGLLDFDGSVTNNVTRSITVTGAGFADFGGDVTNNGTMTFASNSTAAYNGTSAQTVAGLAYHHLVLTGDNSKNAATNLTVAGTFTNRGSTILDMGTGAFTFSTAVDSQATNAKLRFGGTTHGYAIASGIVEYYGAAGSTVTVGTYGQLNLSGTGVATVSDLTIVNNDLNVGASADLTLASGTLRVGADGTGDLNVTGTISNSGTITVGE